MLKILYFLLYNNFNSNKKKTFLIQIHGSTKCVFTSNYHKDLFKQIFYIISKLKILFSIQFYNLQNFIYTKILKTLYFLLYNNLNSNKKKAYLTIQIHSSTKSVFTSNYHKDPFKRTFYIISKLKILFSIQLYKILITLKS